MRVNKWIVRLACLTGGTAAAVLVVEGALRAFAPVPASWLAIYAEHPRLPYSLAPSSEWLVDTGVTRWTVQTDERRLRVGSSGPISEGAPHLLAVGDSFAFGYGVDADLGLLGQLESKLGIPIANAAVPGYGPAQYHAALAEHIDREGLRGVIVVSYLGNDFHDAIWDKSVVIHDGILGLAPGWKGRIKRNSHLYRLLSGALHRIGIGASDTGVLVELDLVDRGRWESNLAGAQRVWLDAYGAMLKECESRGLPLVAVVLPSRSFADRKARERVNQLIPNADFELARGKAVSWLKEVGVPLLDACDLLLASAEPRFLPFDGHLTPGANAHLAEALVVGLRTQLGIAR